MSINNALEDLLNNLEEVSAKYGELHDTAVREKLGYAIRYLFVYGSPTRDSPSNNDYAMYTNKGNKAVHKIIVEFLTHPEVKAARVQLTPEERLAALFESEVQSSTGNDFSSFVVL
jgi:hypothetical protein